VTREPLLTPAFLLSFAGTFIQGLAFNLYLHLPGYLQDLGPSGAPWTAGGADR
jgi:hypothetical protein